MIYSDKTFDNNEKYYSFKVSEKLKINDILYEIDSFDTKHMQKCIAEDLYENSDVIFEKSVKLDTIIQYLKLNISADNLTYLSYYYKDEILPTNKIKFPVKCMYEITCSKLHVYKSELIMDIQISEVFIYLKPNIGNMKCLMDDEYIESSYQKSDNEDLSEISDEELIPEYTKDSIFFS